MCIESSTFARCSSLQSVLLPDGVMNIGEQAFINCYKLRDFSMPNKLVSVGDAAFMHCTNIVHMTMPKGPETIGKSAFEGCCGLVDIIIPSSVMKIGDDAFFNCRPLTVEVPQCACDKGLEFTFRYMWPYSGLSIENVVVAEGVTNIGASVFSDCKNLRSVVIPSSVEHIDDTAFAGCSRIKSVRVPQYVCNRKLSAIIPSSYRTISSVTIAAEVLNIGDSAFAGCSGLPSVVVPESVTNIGQGAFSGCSSLTNVIFVGDAPCVGGNVFDGVNAKVIVNPWRNGWELSLSATWNGLPIKYSTPVIFFDANGGNDIDTVIITENGSITNSLPVTERVGHSFAGWWTQAIDGEMIDVTSIWGMSSVVFAQWTINKYMVAFDANNDAGSVTNEQEYASEIVPPTVTREGYTFVGWMPSLPETVPPSNVTYTAQWQINQYEVAFDGNGGALGESALPKIVASQDYGSAIVAPTVTKEGHTFVGWWPEVAVTVPASNVTYTAQWEINKYTVSFDPKGGTFEGRFAEEDPLLIATNGIPVGVLPTPVRPGNIFLGWYDGEESEEPIGPETVITGDLTLYARWVAAWTVTLNANGGSFVDEDGGTGANAVKVLVVKGGPLGERALPKLAGYSFAGWWTRKSGGVKITAKTKVTKDVTYYAHWTVKKFKVAATVNTKAGGAVSGAGAKSYGSKATLKAAPKKGYVFVKWVNADDEGMPWPSALKRRQPSVTFTMGAANVSVKAVFAKASADPVPVLSVEPGDAWYVEDDPGREISVAADSLSYPAVTLSGAPAGIGLVRVPDTDDRYVMKVTDASKMKPGVYTVKVTAKNRAGKSASKSVKIVTPNSSDAVNAGLMAGIEPSTLNPYVLGGGMKLKKTLADLGVEVFQTNGWKLVSVTGLPPGLSWNGTAIVGAASKAGVFTVTFTMKKTVRGAKTKKTKTYTSTATATFAVDALLPGEVAGTYNGFANTSVADSGDNGEVGDGEDGDDNEVENVIYTPIMDGWASAVKVTVTAAGKITANIGGVAITGNGFDSVSNGVYAVTLKKTQKITKGSLKGKSKVWEAYLEIDTGAAWHGRQVSGWFYTYNTGVPSMTAPAYISAQRNVFGNDADAKAMSVAVAGTRKFALKSVKGEEWSYDLVPGGKALSVVVKQNGVTTLAGKIDSVKVSGTGTLEVGETAATARFFSGKFAIEVVYAFEDGTVVSASGRVWKK